MGSATSLLHIGNSGVSASRKKLATAGHNIANVNTEGFSRQRATQETTTPIKHGNVILGTGTQVSSAKRIHNKYLEKKLGLSITDHEFHKERNFQLGQIEAIFNEVDMDGLNSMLNKFFNSFRELSKQPDNEAFRSIVRGNAKQLVGDFKRIKKSLNELQFSMDEKIFNAMNDINLLLHKIGKLNIKISEIENGGGETGDLRDQRDLAIRKLSEFFELNVYEGDNGHYTVSAKGVGTLVTSGNIQELRSERSSDSKSYLPGGREVYFKDRSHHTISPQLSSGRLKAILSSRNNELKLQQKKIDDLAFSFSKAVNAIHRRGFANKKVPIGPNGVLKIKNSTERFSGINFFNNLQESYRAAEAIDLSKDIKRDLRNIVTSQKPNAPGDNRIAIAITNLQHSKVLNNETSTFEGFYLQGIGKIATASQESNINVEHSSGILAQNKALKEKISGVSIDEETANMIRFQQAFDASARVMSVADEMFKTVLGIKKL